jgi:hypothetical protein
MAPPIRFFVAAGVAALLFLPATALAVTSCTAATAPPRAPVAGPSLSA